MRWVDSEFTTEEAWTLGGMLSVARHIRYPGKRREFGRKVSLVGRTYQVAIGRIDAKVEPNRTPGRAGD